MKMLISKNELLLLKATDRVPLECENCGAAFSEAKSKIIYNQRKGYLFYSRFCSRKCRALYHKQSMHTACKNCNKKMIRKKSESKKSKSKNFFCSCSCAGKYNSKHKTTGNRRSKLEIYIEKKINIIYPQLEVIYNDRNELSGYELDIYFPKLKLAFELNGIFHYEPIFGQNKLQKIQLRDKNKFQSCINKNISLCIIDISSLKYFKEKNAEKFIELICNVINNHMKLLEDAENK